jgi:aminocarboxymuconate-semialdehyde decarboxylase
MTTRRDFLGTAGIAIVGCGLLGTPHAHAQARRRETVVNGKRMKVVDVHAHCAVPEAMALMDLKLGGPSLRPDLDMTASVAARIAAMDAQGVDVEALSINPYWYKAGRDVAEALIKIQNEKLAEVCAANPERFVAFASVALQYPDLAARQLEAALKTYVAQERQRLDSIER